MVWLPADRFTWANGGEAVGFIPTRYSRYGAGRGVRPLTARAQNREWNTHRRGGIRRRVGQRILVGERRRSTDSRGA